MLRRLATILAVTTLTLSLIAALTGVLLAFYYGPNAGEVHDEIKHIVNEVPNGWLIHSLHDTAGNGLIAVCLGQIVVMFLGRQFRLGWLTAWIGGVALTLTAIALGWSAMNLDWTQLGYWRFKIELGTTLERSPNWSTTTRDPDRRWSNWYSNRSALVCPAQLCSLNWGADSRHHSLGRVASSGTRTKAS